MLDDDDELIQDTEELRAAVQMLQSGTLTDDTMHVLYQHFHALPHECREVVLQVTGECLFREISQEDTCNWELVDTVVDELRDILENFDDGSRTETFGMLVPSLFAAIIYNRNEELTNKSMWSIVLIMRHMQFFSEDWTSYLVTAANVVPLHIIFAEMLLLEGVPCPEICDLIWATASDTLMREKSEYTYLAMIIVTRMIRKGLEVDYGPVITRILDFGDDVDIDIIIGILAVCQTVDYFSLDLIGNTMRVIQGIDNFGHGPGHTKCFATFVRYTGTFKNEIQSDVGLCQEIITFACKYIDHDSYPIKLSSLVLLLNILPEFPEYDDNLCRIILENFQVDLITRRVFSILIHWIEQSSTEAFVNLVMMIGTYLEEITDFLEGQETAEAIQLSRYLDVLVYKMAVFETM